MSKLELIQSHYNSYFGIEYLLDVSDDASIDIIYLLCQNNSHLIDRICQGDDSDIVINLSAEGCNLIGIYFQFELKDNVTMRKYYTIAIKKGNINALYNLGSSYRFTNEHLMIKCYQKAARHGHIKAMKRLADFYQRQRKYVKMIKYYQLAINKDDPYSMLCLGIYYKNSGDYENMKNCFVKAINKGDEHAMHELGLFYDDTPEHSNAEKYYLMAIEKGHQLSMFGLGLYYQKNNIFKKMTMYYLLFVLQAKGCDDIKGIIQSKLRKYISNDQMIEYFFGIQNRILIKRKELQTINNSLNK